MNRSVWLSALVLLTVLETGCQTAKLPAPKWPDFAMFKQKDKDLAPPSEHFDLSTSQVAAAGATERKANEIPGEAPASAVTSPSQLARPTAPIAATRENSGKASAAVPPAVAPATANAAAPQPIRKPYELAKSATDSVEQSATALAAKLDQNARAATDQLNRNANEVVGQFQQQGRALADSATNAVQQAGETLAQKADSNGFGFPPPSSNGPSNNPASSTSTAGQAAAAGGAFAFSRPTTPAPTSSSAPPWSSGGTPAPAFAGAVPNTGSSGVPTGPVDPLKTLSAPAALSPMPAAVATGNPANQTAVASASLAPPRQLQPINQELVNQNLGATAPSGQNQFQLPVTQPPAFVANRSASISPERPTMNPGNGGLNPGQTSSPMQPMASDKSIAAASPAAGSSNNPGRYPSTGFNSFTAAGNQGPGNSSSSNLALGTPSGAPAATGTARINSDWQTQSQPVASASKPFQPSNNQPVSHTAELPAELRQRSGSYAPGSVGGGSTGDTLWR